MVDLASVVASVPSGSAIDSSEGPEADTTQVFMWTGASNFLPQDSLLFRPKLAFAKWQNIILYESGIHDADELRRFLRFCREAGIEQSWIEIGPNDGVTAEEFATDSSARAPTLERFRSLARAYRPHAPETARITIFDEAPLGAFDSNPDASYREHVASFRTHGPEGFAHLYRALKEEMPEAEVGIFLHHPHNASRSMAGPHTFIYSDVYRGYFNRGYGVEATNEYITDVVAHTKEVACHYGAEAHHLGQTHMIKLGYTPSQWEIDTNVKAMLQGSPDGVGWYWPNYASTNHAEGLDGSPAQPEGYDDRWHAVVFHGLDRTAHVSSRESGKRVEVKVTTRDERDASQLGAAYMLPYRTTRHDVTEEKATTLIENQPRWMSVNSLAHHVRPVPDTLPSGASKTYLLAADAPFDTTRLQEWQRRFSP